MELNELSQKWALLASSGNKNINSIRLDSNALPNLFIGINQNLNRCLILQLPLDYKADFQTSVKQNLSLELFEDTRWVVMSLLDEQYIDLFDDLIYSIYNKIKDMNLPSDYMSEFLKTYYKWSEFFQENNGNTLSDESVRGLFGELVFLHNILEESDSILLNDVLNSWKGPYDTGHDFVGEFKNIEVKTKTDLSSGIRISSEYQLQCEIGKELELVIVIVKTDSSGFSLRDLINLIRELVIVRLGDYTILLKAISQKGLTLKNISNYEHLRYIPQELIGYSCDSNDFPKLITHNIPDAIDSLSYRIKVHLIEHYITYKKTLQWK